jgi:6-phosphogluconolactonase (cycloisomerase 2 family)
VVVVGAIAASVAGGRPSVYATVSGSKKAGVAQFDVLAGGVLKAKKPGKVGPANDLAGVAVHPNGRTAYVAFNSTNPGTGPTKLGKVLLQYRIDLQSGKLSRAHPFKVRSGVAPTAIVLTPKGRFAYAANSSSDSISQYKVKPSGLLSPLSPRTVKSGNAPLDLAVSPNGRHLYASNVNEGDRGITQYDIRRNGTLRPMSPRSVDANQPSNIVLTPSGRSAYVPVLGAVEQYTVNRKTGKLTPKTPATLPLGIAPDGAAVTPKGRSLYVGTQNAINQFSISRSNDKLTPKKPPLVAVPGHAIASINDLQVAPNGRTLYASAACCTRIFQYRIAHGSERLAPKRRASVGSIDTPAVIAVAPDNPTARFSARSSALSVRFDARASYDSGAGIRRYEWSFGDGTKQSRLGSSARHRYRHPGRFRVTLKVTSSNGCRSGRRISTGHEPLCTGARARTQRVVRVSR